MQCNRVLKIIRHLKYKYHCRRRNQTPDVRLRPDAPIQLIRGNSNTRDSIRQQENLKNRGQARREESLQNSTDIDKRNNNDAHDVCLHACNTHTSIWRTGLFTDGTKDSCD